MAMGLFDKAKKNKKSKELKIKFIKVFIVLLIVGTILAGFKAVINNLCIRPHFNIKSVIIEGSSLNTREAARYSNIDLPSNILKIDLKRVSLDIKRVHPELKEVIVLRELPDTLKIILIKREPVAEIEINNKFYRIDEDAFILSDYSKASDPKLTNIIGIRRLEVTGNKFVKCKSEKLEEALELLVLLRETQIINNYKVTAIDVSNHRDTTFVIENKVKVRLGGKGNFKKALALLKESLPSIKMDESVYIDLRFGNVITGIN